MKDVWIDLTSSRKGRMGLVCYEDIYVYFRSVVTGNYRRSEYPLRYLAEAHKKLLMRRVN